MGVVEGNWVEVEVWVVGVTVGVVVITGGIASVVVGVGVRVVSVTVGVVVVTGGIAAVVVGVGVRVVGVTVVLVVVVVTGGISTGFGLIPIRANKVKWGIGAETVSVSVLTVLCNTCHCEPSQ